MSYEDCVYVEIGVESGSSAQAVSPFVAELHGCDIENYSFNMPPGSTFWHMPSEDFWQQYDGSAPDVIFIDGDHRYGQARADYEAAKSTLAPGGTILLHDTWPESEEQMQEDKPEDLSQPWCGTVYLLREELEANGVRPFTWTSFPGLTAVKP